MVPTETTIHGGHKQDGAFTSHAESAQATAADATDAPGVADADTADDRHGMRQRRLLSNNASRKSSEISCNKGFLPLALLGSRVFFVLRTTPHLEAMIYDTDTSWSLWCLINSASVHSV